MFLFRLRIDFSTCETDATIKMDNVDIQVNKHVCLQFAQKIIKIEIFYSFWPSPPPTLTAISSIAAIRRQRTLSWNRQPLWSNSS